MSALSRGLMIASLLLHLGCENQVSAEQAQPQQPLDTSSSTSITPDTYATDIQALLPAQHSSKFYGVYLQGNKVGWMEQSVQVNPSHIESKTKMYAEIRGMGRDTTLELSEGRRFNTHGALQSVGFNHSAMGSAMSVQAEVKDGQLHIASSTAGQRHDTHIPIAGRGLLDEWAAIALAKTGSIGDTTKSLTFDPSTKRFMQGTHRLAKIENRNMGGVDTQIVLIQNTFPEMGVREETWFTRDGDILETQIGGFLTLRLEPEADAKTLDYAQDVIVSAMVRSPYPIAKAETYNKMVLSLQSPTDTPLPSDTRQFVQPAASQKPNQKQSQQSNVTITKDTPSDQPYPLVLKEKVADFKQYLRSEDTIQSDASEIINQAKALTKGLNRFQDVIVALTHFVSKHLKDDYVPAYSNALEAWRTQTGDCTEHSVLFVALARAAGIPARPIGGIAYWPPGKGFGWHAWAEVFDGKKWITVDPTWDQPIADVTHLKLAQGSPAEQARIVMLLGRIQIDSLVIQ